MNLFTILVAILMFCMLIFVHEFGHFAAAKLLGVRVNEFSIGMGPLLFHKIKGETEYSLRAFPIGGYCKLEGEDEESSDSKAFNNQPAYAKIIILAAGAFMNILSTLVVLSMVFWYAGSYTPQLSVVSDGMPAQEAGLEAGDVITAVDGQSYDDWQAIVNAIATAKGENITIDVDRDGLPMTFVSEIALNEEGRQVIGIQPAIVHSFTGGVKEAFTTMGTLMLSMRDFLVNLFTGKASGDDVVGVIGIITIIGQQAQQGTMMVIYLMAIISLNLGLVNLLPLPALDGGRILFVIIRFFAKGRISDEAEGRVHAVGMVLLMALMVFLLFKDTFKYIIN